MIRAIVNWPSGGIVQIGVLHDKPRQGLKNDLYN